MKTKLSFVFLFILHPFAIINCFSQAGEWVWIKGDSIPDQPGNFGVQGVPSPTNNPPSLYEPCEWTDLNGNFWLFGGLKGYVVCNDLWKYNSVSNEWVWIKGPGIPNDPGHYGVQGIPSPVNNPPSRGYGMLSWVDNQNCLWLYGGWNYSIASYSDLWKYDISTNEWTWIRGSTTGNQPGIYGIQGIPDPANTPGSRNETAASWTDNLGALWMFGGFGWPGWRNELWKYDVLTNEWTWMKGQYCQIGVYGIIGVEDSLNIPGCRMVYSRWKDNTGKLWLFGGRGGYNLNDLWRYNIMTNNWTWMGGSNVNGATGYYGTKCIVSPGNMPRPRTENRAAWTDQSGNFWLFGGGRGNQFSEVWNDLWKYCVNSNQWIWISGNKVANPLGTWGTLGVSSPNNKPNGRAGAISWTDNNGHLYLFGGSTTLFNTSYNDLWKYTIDTTCGVCPVTTSVQENINSVSTIEIFPNPSSETFTVRSGDYVIDKIEIYNLLGEKVYEKQLSAVEYEVSTLSFGNGIYIIKIYMHEMIFQKKLVIHH